jgi:hypothetical protein
MDASNLKRMNADQPGVDPSAFFPTRGAKEEEGTVERREFLSVISVNRCR